MTIQEALFQRVSRRAYDGKPLNAEMVKVLERRINFLNAQSGLYIQLAVGQSEAFQSILKTYGLFRGVANYIGMVGKDKDPDLEEKVGYFGEMLVLEATALGLDTCFVGGSYDKEKVALDLPDDTRLVLTIAIGHAPKDQSFREKIIRAATHRRSLPLETLFTTSGDTPEWFMNGMRGIASAPSALHRQPVRFDYDHGKVTANLVNQGALTFVDLGIAKANFVIASGVGTWDFGDGGQLQY